MKMMPTKKLSSDKKLLLKHVKDACVPCQPLCTRCVHCTSSCPDPQDRRVECSGSSRCRPEVRSRKHKLIQVVALLQWECRPVQVRGLRLDAPGVGHTHARGSSKAMASIEKSVKQIRLRPLLEVDEAHVMLSRHKVYSLRI